MATSTAQRVGIWVIAGAMIVGTLAGFAVMIIAPGNEAADQERIQAASAKYQADYEAYQQKLDAQTKQLSEKYYKTFSEYRVTPAAFDAASVKEVKTNDLKEGTGETIGDETKFGVYYIGWNPSAKVFDQSIEGESLKAPLYASNEAQGFIGFDRGLKNATVIEGWKEGLKGMKVGGVRVITIPSDKAYGEQGSGEDIPANTPIAFVVMAIEPPEVLKQPEFPQELMQ